MIPTHITLTEEHSGDELREAIRRHQDRGLVLATTPEEAIELARLFHEGVRRDADRIADLTRGMKVGDVIEIPGPLYF